MPGILQGLNSSPNLANFASGALVNMTRPVAAFIAPPVTVDSITFPYKTWAFTERMAIRNVNRAIGGRANQFAPPTLTQTWVTLKAKALEMILAGIIVSGDFNSQLASSEGQFEARQAINLLTSAQGLAMAYEVITALVNGAGSSVATLSFSTTTNDPVALLDSYILSMIEAVGTDRINILFGSTAWNLFKNNPNIIARKMDLTWENSPSLFAAQAKYLPSYEVGAPDIGLSVGYLLPPNAVFMFPAIDDPDNFSDPSFMKTFRTASSHQVKADPEGVSMGPIRFYNSQDGRDIIASIDYEQLSVVTAPGTAVQLTVS